MNLISKILLSAAATALATAASAQISNISSATDAELMINGSDVVLGSPVPSPNYQSGAAGGAGYSTKAITQDGAIFFQAGSMSAGTLNGAKSSVSVSFDYLNSTDQVVDNLVSTVFESNFGMYVANFNAFPPPPPGNNNFKPACTGANLPNCTPVNSGPDLTAIGTVVDEVEPFTLAYTSFLFEIIQDDVVRKSIGGTLQLDTDGEGNLNRITGGIFNSLSMELNDFEEFIASPDRVWAYSWGDTDVSATLNPIGIGDSSTLTYRITTESWTDAEFRGQGLNTIVSFACFADPIGRGTSGALFTVPGFLAATCDDYTGGGSNAPTNYSLRIAEGAGTLYLTRDGAPPVPGIPEPDTWAMLILGFGLVGLSMRRAKKPNAATVNA